MNMNAQNVARSISIHFAGKTLSKRVTHGIVRCVKSVAIGGNGIANLVIPALMESHCPVKGVEKNLPMRL